MDSTTEQKQVTSAAAWSAPRREGMIVELPSGNVARLRRSIDLMYLLKTGQIPNPLAGIVQNMIKQQNAAFPMKDMDEKALQQMLDLVENTCVQCFVEPRVEIPERIDSEIEEDGKMVPVKIANPAWEPSEGAISIDDLNAKDKFFVFGFVQGGTTDLRPFRDQPEQAVDAAQDGDGVQPEAEPTAGS
jgi:hypothetical protein